MVKGKRGKSRVIKSNDETDCQSVESDGPKAPKDSRLEEKTMNGFVKKMAPSIIKTVVTVSKKKEISEKITNYFPVFSPSRSPPAGDDAGPSTQTTTGPPEGAAATSCQCGDDISHQHLVNGVHSSVHIMAFKTRSRTFNEPQALLDHDYISTNNNGAESKRDAAPHTSPVRHSSRSPLQDPKSITPPQPGSGPSTPHKIQALNEEKLRLDSPLSPSSALSRLALFSPRKKLAFKGGRTSKAKGKLKLPNGCSQVPTAEVVKDEHDEAFTNGSPRKPHQNGLTKPIQNGLSKPLQNGLTKPLQNGLSKPNLRSTQMTEFFPIRRSARKPKATLLREWQKEVEDKILVGEEEGLKVESFGTKGRGVVTSRSFEKGEFVVEYIGELIDLREARHREATYSMDASKGCYSYYFTFQDQQYCIDATEETGKLGRLVNHSRQRGNLVTKTVEVNGRPHLILVAKRDLMMGEELLYDYGDRSKESLQNHPWLLN